MSNIRRTDLGDLDLKTYVDESGQKTEYSRFFVSDPGTEHPIQVGVFRFSRSELAMLFHHGFEEGKYVIEGEVTIVDKESGQVCEAKAGDMLHVKGGTSCYWWTPSHATVFFCGTSDEIAQNVWHAETPVADLPIAQDSPPIESPAAQR